MQSFQNCIYFLTFTNKFMKQNKVTEQEEITMDIELYRCKLMYLQKIQNFKQFKGIKLLLQDNTELLLEQNNIPFSMQMELNILLTDSIEYYQHQLEWLTNFLNTKTN